MRSLQTLGALLWVAALSVTYGQAPPLDQTRPDIVAKAYLAALGAGDTEAAIRCLNPATEGRGAPELIERAIPKNPSLRDMQVFRCPEAADLECGYAYNLEVAGKMLTEIARPSETVLFYESTLGRLDAVDKGESQPRPGRHDGANNLAYVDGHVWPQPPP